MYSFLVAFKGLSLNAIVPEDDRNAQSLFLIVQQ